VRRRRLFFRLHVTLVVVGLTAFLVPAVALPPAEASTSAAQEFVDRLNAERASRGLRALTVAGDLAGVARSWSSRMASDDHLRHNPNLRNEACCWTRLTENVGTASGGSGHVNRVHEAFMASSTHRANILDATVDQVGVGVVVTDDGKTWVTQVFRRTTSSAAPEPATKPSPSPAATTPVESAPAAGEEREPDPEPTTVKLRRWKDASVSILTPEDVVLLDKMIDPDDDDDDVKDLVD
jgi:uncharacterized protein YkwD